MENEVVEEVVEEPVEPDPTTSASHVLGWDADPNAFGFSTRQSAAQSRGSVLYPGSGHRMTFGSTGSGKAVSAAIPELLSFEGNAIVLDIKSELYSVTARWRRDVLGHQIVLLDPFNVVDDATKDGLNPLDLGELLGCSTYESAATIASLFCGASQNLASSRNSTNDDFWQDQAMSLVTGAIGMAMEGKVKTGASLPAVRELLKSEDTLLNMATILEKAPPSKPFYEEIASFLQTTDVTRSGILSTALAHFRGLAGDGVEALLRKTTFDLPAFIHGDLPATIYVVIPPEQLLAQHKLVRLLFGTLLSALYTRRYIPQQKTLVQVDECATLGAFDPIRTGITLFRGSGVILHTLFQDLDQVMTNYTDAKTLINNTSVIRLLGTSNYWQAKMLSDLFGVSPQVLMSLEPDEQLVLIDGRAQRCRRVNYLHDSLFAGRFDPNPRYAAKKPGSDRRRNPVASTSLA